MTLTTESWGRPETRPVWHPAPPRCQLPGGRSCHKPTAGRGPVRSAGPRRARYRGGMAAVPYPQVPGPPGKHGDDLLPYRDLGSEILASLEEAMPDGATFGFNQDHR
jgi:hypothetical protein